jgi:hypothetical protein
LRVLFTTLPIIARLTRSAETVEPFTWYSPPKAVHTVYGSWGQGTAAPLEASCSPTGCCLGEPCACARCL